MKLTTAFAAAAAVSAVLLSTSDAQALPESKKGPGYVQLNFPVVGFHLDRWGYGYRAPEPIGMDFSGGYHFSGRHDGFVIGGTQKVVFNQEFWAATMLRLGWDVPIPIAKKFELTIAPYANVGAQYGMGSVRFMFNTGVEARFFPFHDGGAKGFFATVRPVEIGILPMTGHTFVVWNMAAGAGWAF